MPKYFFITVEGGVPFPILMGAIFDSTCQIWQEKCGSTGSCWVYDTQLMAHRLFLCLLVIKAVSGIAFFLSFFLYKPPPDLFPTLDIDDILRDNESEDKCANGVMRNVDPKAPTAEHISGQNISTGVTSTFEDSTMNTSTKTGEEINIVSMQTTVYEGMPNGFGTERLEKEKEQLVRIFFTPTSVDEELTDIYEELTKESRVTKL